MDFFFNSLIYFGSIVTLVFRIGDTSGPLKLQIKLSVFRLDTLVIFTAGLLIFLSRGAGAIIYQTVCFKGNSNLST